MKLQPASRREVSRIAIGTLVCDLILVAGLFLLSQFGIGTFDPIKILLSALGGSVVAVINFVILCITVQQAVEIDSKKKMKAKFQFSYNVRMVVQAIWVVVCFLVPQLHLVAGAVPLLFPKVTILFLQSIGRLMPPSEKAEVQNDSQSE